MNLYISIVRNLGNYEKNNFFRPIFCSITLPLSLFIDLDEDKELISNITNKTNTTFKLDLDMKITLDRDACVNDENEKLYEELSNYNTELNYKINTIKTNKEEEEEKEEIENRDDYKT